MMSKIPSFYSDYMEGAHPRILERLVMTNEEKTVGYGTDEYTLAARDRVRLAVGNPRAEVHFLAAGTLTNAIVLTGILYNYEGVVSVDSGHIATHEAGAIEAGGHKVITVKGVDGKMTADALYSVLAGYRDDEIREHTVKPQAVYLSQPTEYGTLYSEAEMTEISRIAHEFGAYVYVDGARLGYALASSVNDLTLPRLAELVDVFYIGGTKCGALFGEAVVITNPNILRGFTSTIKRAGALFAKGRILGIQFETLFTDNLYVEICKNAIREADFLKAELKARGYSFFLDSPTNQQFPIVKKEKYEELKEKGVGFSTWSQLPDGSYVIRLVTSVMTKREDVLELLSYM